MMNDRNSCVFCFLSGMDLFEEALRRWEEALMFRDKQAEDDVSCDSVKTGAGDAIAEQGMEVGNTAISSCFLCDIAH